MDDIDLDNLTCLLDFAQRTMLPDHDDFDPAEPLEAWPDDMTMDVVTFMNFLA